MKQIVFTKLNTAELIDMEDREITDDEIKIKTSVSTISSGTEKANITGDTNTNIYAPETEKANFPRMLGYSSSGIVIEVGKNIKNVKVGDRVAAFNTKHSQYNILDKDHYVKIQSDKISLGEAALCYIATFPLAALRKTRLELGESMLVMGLGTLGLLGVTLAKAGGAAPVIAVDPVAERREKALKFGADYALDPFDKDFVKKVKELTDGGAKTAIEVTGLGAGLNQCLDCMAKFGRVALLGCTRDKNFTVDYYRKVHGPGITLVGAHTMARPEQESYPGYFTHKDDIKALLKLCEFQRINLKDMIDEVHSPEECKKVYERLVNDKNFPTVVQFDWNI